MLCQISFRRSVQARGWWGASGTSSRVRCKPFQFAHVLHNGPNRLCIMKHRLQKEPRPQRAQYGRQPGHPVFQPQWKHAEPLAERASLQRASNSAGVSSGWTCLLVAITCCMSIVQSHSIWSRSRISAIRGQGREWALSLYKGSSYKCSTAQPRAIIVVRLRF